MDYKEITDLIKMVNKSNLTEFKMRDGDFEITIRTENYSKGRSNDNNTTTMVPVTTAQPVQHIISQAPAQQQQQVEQNTNVNANPVASKENAAEAAEAANEYIEIRSPIVGTFYRASSPEKPPYAKVGDVIEKGDVVCIVEAMKLFNEIESEVSGKIVKVVVDDAQPVEYDQVLYLVDPKG